MLIQNKRIAIIGGGPGGLTLARLLQIKGAEVKVYERDADPLVRQQGATLDLHEDSGLLALREAGLLEAFKQHYRPGADKTKVVNESGQIFSNDHDAKPEADFGAEHFRPEIDRGPLRDLLIASLQPGTMVWNSRLTGQEPIDGGWKLYFDNDTTATADMMIAADGAHSKLRSLVTDVKPFYTGVTAVEGSVHNAAVAAPQMHAFVQGGKVFAFGDGQCIILSAKGDGSITFYMSLHVEENSILQQVADFTDKAAVQRWFTQTFTGWGSLWQELFMHATGSFIHRPIYCFPVNQQWEAQPNITLLGDAAHLMPPYAGEGVNMAMQDAWELSECLTSNKYDNVLMAISHYETRMRARAAEKAQESLDNTVWMHQPGALEKILKIFGN